MKLILFFLSIIIYTFSYDRDGALYYAYKYAETPNHKCGSYSSCTPCSYWESSKIKLM